MFAISPRYRGVSWTVVTIIRFKDSMLFGFASTISVCALASLVKYPHGIVRVFFVSAAYTCIISVPIDSIVNGSISTVIVSFVPPTT